LASDEFIINSVFGEDFRKHMSINMETGLWQDFKYGERGNFVQLVSIVEEISLDEAASFLRKKLLHDPQSLFTPVRPIENKAIEVKNSVPEEFKNFTPVNITKFLKSGNLMKRFAAKFILSRKLQKFKFFFGESGVYKNRLIIPYTHKGKPFYFQARSLSSFGMKYLNPKAKECGVKSSDILFPFNEEASYVILTEGPLDAITLQVNGYNATSTQGSNMSYAQMRSLKGKKIIVSYDNDSAGKKGEQKIDVLRKTLMFPTLYAIHPPGEFKDWNDFFTKSTSEDFEKYVNSNVKPMDFLYQVSGLLT